LHVGPLSRQAAIGDLFSRQAAIECSPRRKPWEVTIGNDPAPKGRKKSYAANFAGTYENDPLLPKTLYLFPRSPSASKRLRRPIAHAPEALLKMARRFNAG